MGEIVIRRVQPDDVERYREVRLAALHDSPTAFGSTYAREAALDDDAWVERTRGASAGLDLAVFLALDDDHAVGLAGGHRSGDRSTELISMWSSPSVRRLGVGRRLVDTVVDWARGNGDERVGLWVTVGNEPARALYEAAGFVATGERDVHPSADGFEEERMVLEIAP